MWILFCWVTERKLIFWKTDNVEVIPAFRIINGNGELRGAFHFSIPDMQKVLLENEGVEMSLTANTWCVDLKKYGWVTTEEDAACFAESF